MDTLVFDIETKNSFFEVGGEKNIRDLNVSVVGVYSYNKDEYLCFDEHQLEELGELFKRAGLIIGFSINRFDIPVLKKYFNFNIHALSRLDLLEEIERSIGKRISLDILSKTNLGGEGKTHPSLHAITLYKEGNMEELKNYCLNDVRLTKELYDLAKTQGYLKVPRKYTGELVKAEFDWHEEILPQTLF